MLFSWLRARRRRKLLAEPFPLRWDGIIGRNVGHFSLLSAMDQDRVRDVARILIAEKRWHGRGGLFVREEMKVTIAAQAALLLLGNDRGYFCRTRDVYIFPTEFRTPVYDDDWEDDGLSERPLAGQAVYAGQVMLAWDQVLPEGREPGKGYNVVLHEFAHQLDFAEGLVGGIPDLGDRTLESRWKYVMAVAFEDHRRAVRENRDALFTPHAADNEAEFFADATEALYCRPVELKELHAELYQLLAAYFRVDPAVWFSRA